ncbi:zinc finger MYM-type protein 1-like [Engraulis encrasicolus]|uniref:zinc finger MYM-type protein 1-like n=1 Tax=Engraulis encrasicolus TaxID=184585 RepID=UPI002FD27ECC
METTSAETLSCALNDALLRMGLSWSDCRGQCYDGAANMSGCRSGVQARVRALQEEAMYVHCNAHTLNLAFQGAVAESSACRDAMNTVKDLKNSIRESPKRQAWFDAFRKPTGGNNLRPLCPTRWTMRVNSVISVLSNYTCLASYLSDVADKSRGDIRDKSSGFLNQLGKFSFYFTLWVLKDVMHPMEQVNSDIQSPQLSLADVKANIDVLTNSLLSKRNEGYFSSFYEGVVKSALESTVVGEPKIPKARTVPRRLQDGGNSTGVRTYSDPKAYFQSLYFQVLDSYTACLNNRFSEAFKRAQLTEDALLAKITGDTGTLDWDSTALSKDVDVGRLEVQLEMLGDTCRARRLTIRSMHDLKEFFVSDVGLKGLFTEVVKAIQVFYTLPVTTCTAERSFSALRRLKTYLRSTMTAPRLNHLAVLYTHKEHTDQIDLKKIANEFIGANGRRGEVFAKF